MSKLIKLEIGETVIIDNSKVQLEIKSEWDGLFVKNVSENAAVHKRRRDRRNFLFTNAEPIQSWQEYSLLIGDKFING